MRFLDWSEVERARSETVEPYGNLVRFACLTGLRQGELFALRDRAIDLEGRSLVVEAGAREGQLVPTKTSAGRRQVRMSGEAQRIVRDRSSPAPERARARVPDPGGVVWRKDNFMARIFRPAVRRAELAPLRFHDLRHTYAALMVAPAPIPSSSRPNSATARSTSRSTPTVTSSPAPSRTSAKPSTASSRRRAREDRTPRAADSPSEPAEPRRRHALSEASS